MNDNHKRIVTLSKEGMPATWIAEELGLSVGRVREIVSRWLPDDLRQKNTVEWSMAWSQIRPNEELLELHREFAPK